ncbi:MAG: response regulator, partial [Ignavibacteriaceae bacterium]
KMKTSSKINNRGIDILVVEDSPTQAEELIYTLIQNHFYVRKASNGKEAVSFIEQQKPMLVISDIMMPEMNGYELSQYIKGNENLRDIPVILLTSLSDPQDIIRGLESGADNFIMKPFDENYLLSRIDYVVANRDLQQNERLEMGVEIFFGGKRYFINSQKKQILDLLISTYESAIKKNEELKKTQLELRILNEDLEKKVLERTALLTQEIVIRKKNEEELVKLRKAVDTSGEAIFLTDRNGIIQFINPEFTKLYGFTSDEVVGKVTPRILKSGSLSLEDYKCFWDKILNKEIVKGEILNKTKDGKLVVIERTVSPILDEEKNIIGFLAVQRDISERKHAEAEIQKLNSELENRIIERTAQLESAYKELEAFSYSVSHDLRAPLRSINGFSSALLKNYSDKLDEKGKKYLQFVNSATKKMNDLIEDLIGLSRVSRAALNCSTVDLSLIVNNIISDLRKDDPSRSYEFIIEQGLSAECDKNLISIVIENLLRNSFKYSSKKPNTSIEFNVIKKDGEKNIFFVRDKGAGFNMKYAGKLFGPFQRLHSESEFPGTGIGLATVKRIINRHGGNIWAEGEIENGATFYFTL